ncbi:MAG: signal recognition particle protein [Verrucomicrobia bacterium]|nr:signal recognition particle protein [Verrucomicrobiota bacterium]
MFGALTDTFQKIVKSLSRDKELTEANIAEAARTARMALLDADVNYSVVSQLIKKVKAEAVGSNKIKGVNAGDQFLKIVHDKLVEIMGGEEPKISFKKTPTKILLCGLQGAGKTTHAAKLAHFLKKKWHKNPLLVALDLQRPGAIQQLQILGSQINVPVFANMDEKNPLKIAKAALKEGNFDVLIFDTAGRLHIDETLMQELAMLKKEIDPEEIFFVANAASGQDAVTTAQEFNQKIGITNSILTMLDGTTRAGAALSIREITGKPLLFEGVGEKIEDLRLFNPVSMADRILGMGDLINLVKKAEEEFSKDEEKEMEKKMRTASFTFEDFLKQMRALKRMGPLKGLLKMMPGMGDLPADLGDPEKELAKTEAMILSMTAKERQGNVEFIPSRRKRIAKGSGRSIDEVNRLLKSFKELRQMAKHFSSMKKQFKM